MGQVLTTSTNTSDEGDQHRDHQPVPAMPLTNPHLDTSSSDQDFDDNSATLTQPVEKLLELDSDDSGLASSCKDYKEQVVIPAAAEYLLAHQPRTEYDDTHMTVTCPDGSIFKVALAKKCGHPIHPSLPDSWVELSDRCALCRVNIQLRPSQIWVRKFIEAYEPKGFQPPDDPEKPQNAVHAHWKKFEWTRKLLRNIRSTLLINLYKFRKYVDMEIAWNTEHQGLMCDWTKYGPIAALESYIKCEEEWSLSPAYPFAEHGSLTELVKLCPSSKRKRHGVEEGGAEEMICNPPAKKHKDVTFEADAEILGTSDRIELRKPADQRTTDAFRRRTINYKPGQWACPEGSVFEGTKVKITVKDKYAWVVQEEQRLSELSNNDPSSYNRAMSLWMIREHKKKLAKLVQKQEEYDKDIMEKMEEIRKKKEEAKAEKRTYGVLLVKAKKEMVAWENMKRTMNEEKAASSEEGGKPSHLVSGPDTGVQPLDNSEEGVPKSFSPDFEIGDPKSWGPADQAEYRRLEKEVEEEMEAASRAEELEMEVERRAERSLYSGMITSVGDLVRGLTGYRYRWSSE